ncbi:uncharacterized protein LOC122072236 [Macadamia integrifolia]|uniref:uncharacterized protein LOC122072236 n=1 Tax=Macadamia integrifolia TaxID=60698 RepID=UPI001C4F6FED|nr:uncharacterized protein LOC122072236 [Macadamia integrifolia]
MGWAETEMRCKKHPMHRQTPGVCSCCLREKLTKLSNASGRGGMEEAGSSCSSSLSSSPYSSGETSSDSSPVHDRFGYLEGRGSGLFLKSRSVVAIPPRMRSRSRGAVEITDGKKKLGFWSKLIRSTGKKTKKMMLHSSTLKEMSSHNRVY